LFPEALGTRMLAHRGYYASLATVVPGITAFWVGVPLEFSCKIPKLPTKL
jgi:hypothetical protein